MFTFCFLCTRPHLELGGGGQRAINPPFCTIGGIVSLLQRSGDWNIGSKELLRPLLSGEEVWGRWGPVWLSMLEKWGVWFFPPFTSCKGNSRLMPFWGYWPSVSPLKGWPLDCPIGPFKEESGWTDDRGETVEVDEPNWPLSGAKGSLLNGTGLGLKNVFIGEDKEASLGVLQGTVGQEMKGLPLRWFWLTSITDASSSNKTLSS